MIQDLLPASLLALPLQELLLSLPEISATLLVKVSPAILRTALVWPVPVVIRAELFRHWRLSTRSCKATKKMGLVKLSSPFTHGFHRQRTSTSHHRDRYSLGPGIIDNPRFKHKLRRVSRLRLADNSRRRRIRNRCCCSPGHNGRHQPNAHFHLFICLQSTFFGL